MRQMEKRNSLIFCLITVLLFTCYLFLTRYQASFVDAIDWVDANDVFSYLKISASVPDLPNEKIAFHFGQRFIPHYLVGFLAYASGISIESSYYFFNIILIVSILFLAFRILVKYDQTREMILLVFALFALTPYSLRLNVLVPGMLADLVFLLGMMITLTGLFNKRLILIVAGLLMAIIGKQMALLILPGVLVFSYDVWKDKIGKGKTLVFCFITTFLVFGMNWLLAYLSSNFTFENSITSGVLFSIFPWFFSNEFSIALLMEHFLRILLPLFPFILLIAIYSKKSRIEWFTWRNVGLLLMILGPMAYALLPGPIVQRQNQSRYIASVLIAAALLTLQLIPRVELKLNAMRAMFIGLTLVLFSYHHRYCILSSRPKIFLGVHLLSILMLAVWLIRVRSLSNMIDRENPS